MSKTKRKYVGLIIADIHVGAMDLERTRNEFHNQFISYIKSMKQLDFLIVAGDFFDHKIYLGDKESIVAHAMLKELIDICDEKNTVVRFVYGTESHEVDQYSVMSVLQLSDRCRVVKYAEEEELLPDMQVLYLPEEHIYDKDEYYHKYFENEKKYDYIFGHGVIREVWAQAGVLHTEDKVSKGKTRKKVPVFTAGELDNCCLGQIYFGHYHVNKEHAAKIFSIGSFSRWKFGEEGVKGFYEVSFDPDKKTYDYKHIENEEAQSYTTITYGYDDAIFNNQDMMDEGLNQVDKLIKADAFDHVRFVFNIPASVENPEATINYLKERYHGNDKVKVDITNGYIEEKRKTQKEAIKSENEKYQFIFDKSLPLEEKVSRFILIEYDKSLDVEKVADYLYKSLKELISDIGGDEDVEGCDE